MNKLDYHQLVQRLYSMLLTSLDLVLIKLSGMYNMLCLTINNSSIHAAQQHDSASLLFRQAA